VNLAAWLNNENIQSLNSNVSWSIIGHFMGETRRSYADDRGLCGGYGDWSGAKRSCTTSISKMVEPPSF